jgi:hypothetical protein
MKTILSIFAIAIFAASLTSCDQKEAIENQKPEFPELTGPYMGQKLPGTEAVLFAPGIISNGQFNRDVAITPDGKEMYFGLHSAGFKYSTIICTKEVNGKWTKPEVASFAKDPRYVHLEPALSYDGNKLLFLSNMPKDSTDNPADEDIWVVDRQKDGNWGEPYNLGAPINTENSEFYPSLTKDGTIYFNRRQNGERVEYIYRSRLVDGVYQTAEKLPEQVNCGANRFNAFIAPDESFIIVPTIGMKDGMGGVDYYIVFRNDDNTWQEPINMGPSINTAVGTGWSASLSPDQRYLFFMASREMPKENQPKELSTNFFENLLTMPQNGSADIYWIDAKFIEDLKPKN